MASRAQTTTYAADRFGTAAAPVLAGLLHHVQDRQVYSQGDNANTYFTVRSGMVRTCSFSCGGRRQIEGFHGPGDVFGLSAARQYDHSAEAVSDCTVATHRWRGIATDYNGVPHHLFSHAMRSLARAQAHALLLGHRSAIEKVVAFLMEQAGLSPNPARITLEMTRHDIADYLNLTIETVSRTWSQLERASLIVLTTARNIHLRDPARLQALRG